MNTETCPGFACRHSRPQSHLTLQAMQGSFGKWTCSSLWTHWQRVSSHPGRCWAAAVWLSKPGKLWDGLVVSTFSWLRLFDRIWWYDIICVRVYMIHMVFLALSFMIFRLNSYHRLVDATDWDSKGTLICEKLHKGLDAVVGCGCHCGHWLHQKVFLCGQFFIRGTRTWPSSLKPNPKRRGTQFIVF